MCTVSLVASPDGSALRLLMNRDERRLRPVARPPAVHATGAGCAVWPTDPVSGGSWIAVNDAGLALVVMNTDGHRRSPDLLSRGTLIPMFAASRSVDEVVQRFDALDVTAFAPFRLLAIARSRMAVCTSVERRSAISSLGRARLFASSSLGDALVEPLRSELFTRMLGTEPDRWAAQTRVHRHTWPDRRHLSVMMSRVEACTVSQTEVVLTADEASLRYRPVVDGWFMAETRRTLRVAAASSRAA